MPERINRRNFLKFLAGSVAASGAYLITKIFSPSDGNVAAQGAERVYLPYIRKNIPTRTPTPTQTSTPTQSPTQTPIPEPPPPNSPRVVFVHNPSAVASNVDYSSYWQFVNQDAVNQMVDTGVIHLTGKSSITDAWRSIFPNYTTGQKIAIKVNFNNTFDCGTGSSKIDALIQPVNAVVRGLKQMGVSEQNIWVFDATRPMPSRFVSGSLYNVVFYDNNCHTPAGWSSVQPVFNPPQGISAPDPVYLTDVLVNTHYVIDMPLMKPHISAGASLTFKNHFGSIDRPANLHWYIDVGQNNTAPSNYSPMVDLYKNQNIGGKTKLIIGDGIFSSHGYSSPPEPWATFQDKSPCSLFFSTDPVAIDCVLCDYLNAEQSLPSRTDNYLMLASQADLGTYERGNPWGSGYSRIDFDKIEL